MLPNIDNYTLFFFIGLFCILAGLFYVFFDTVKIFYIGITKKRRIGKKMNRYAKKYDYLVLHNLVLALDEEKFFTVDHVLFGDKYVYVFSDKFFLGMVSGVFEDEKWIVKDKKNVSYPANPIKANYARCKVISKIIETNSENIINVVLLADCCDLYECQGQGYQNLVIKENEFAKTISHYELRSEVHDFTFPSIKNSVSILLEHHERNKKMLKKGGKQ